VTIQFSEEAKLDYKEAYQWYSEIDKYLAERFESELDDVLKRLSDSSSQFPKVTELTQRALFGKFPYSLFFIKTDSRIIITAILHHRRNPARWKV